MISSVITNQARALEVTKATNCVCDFIVAASEWARKLDAVPAEERKKRPLFGIPMSVKECFKVKGARENNCFTGWSICSDTLWFG